MTEEGDEREDDMHINVARAGEVDDGWQEPDDSWLELEGGECEDNGGVFCVNAFMGERDLEVEDEFTYYSDVNPSREERSEAKSKEERWWTPDLSWLQSEEEDEEEVRYLNEIGTLGEASCERRIRCWHRIPEAGRRTMRHSLPEVGRQRSEGGQGRK